jgi:hypothetical protein
MKNMRLLAIILLFFISCKSNLPARFYKSPDEVTGGFYDFSLDLKSDGKFKLEIGVSILVKQSESGVEWTTDGKTVTGNWSIKRGSINCKLDEPKSSVDSIFKNTTFSNVEKPVIVFSSKLDTAYIYGIPCVISEKPAKGEDPVRKRL